MLTTLRFAVRSVFWLDWRLTEGATRTDQVAYVFYAITATVLAVFVAAVLVW